MQEPVPFFSASDVMDPSALLSAIQEGQQDLSRLATVLTQCMMHWGETTGVPQSLHMPGAYSVAHWFKVSFSNFRETYLLHHY